MQFQVLKLANLVCFHKKPKIPAAAQVLRGSGNWVLIDCGYGEAGHTLFIAEVAGSASVVPALWIVWATILTFRV